MGAAIRRWDHRGPRDMRCRMTVPAIPRDVLLLRPALVCGNLVGLLFVGIALVRYPASTQQTILYALTLVLLAACAGVALRRARPRTATGARALRFGGAFGLLIGGCWITEVLAGN